MQTFLPYSDFEKSAKCLDYRRLGKQRVEAMQLVKALTDENYGWQNHPITNMWRGYVEALKLYHNIMIYEWQLRGYNNTMLKYATIQNPPMPEWLGSEEFHESHRRKLLWKNPEWYNQFDWGEVPLEEPKYVWL
jgi:hypothetical protein